MSDFVSPYLLKPLRTLEQARADIESSSNGWRSYELIGRGPCPKCWLDNEKKERK